MQQAETLGQRVKDMRGIRRYIVLGTGWTGAVRIARDGLSFLASILLARLLGVAAYGKYQYVLSWIALVGVVAGLGLGQVVTREIAGSAGIGSWARVRGSIRFGFLVTIVTSVLLAVIVAIGARLLANDFAGVFLLAALLLPIRAITDMTNSILVGFKEVIWCTIPDLVQLGTFAGALAYIWFLQGFNLDAKEAVIVNAASSTLSLAVALWMLTKTFNKKSVEVGDAPPSYERMKWLRSGGALMLIAGMITLNNQVDILMIGAMVGEEMVGPYHSATRIANFLTFLLIAAAHPMRPLMAEYYVSGQNEQLQSLVTKVSRIVFILTLPLGMLFVVRGGSLLGWMFGEAFSQGGVALAVLSSAQLICVGAGPVQALLIMCSQESIAAWGVALSTVVNVSMNALLIPSFGIDGAAVGTGLSILAWTALLVRATRRRLNVYPTVLGSI